MVNMILAFLFVLLFSMSCHFLMRTLQGSMDWSRVGEYSQSALKIERKYKIFAWSVLSMALFYAMAMSFYEALSTLN